MKALLTLPKNNTELDVLKVLDHEFLVKFIQHFFHDLNLIIITEFCEVTVFNFSIYRKVLRLTEASKLEILCFVFKFKELKIF